MICLQGHTTGMHISLGRGKYKEDKESIAGDRDFAIQAVRQGYAALVMEQRCFGERQSPNHKNRIGYIQACDHDTEIALLLGRTMVGERVWDVSRAIDSLGEFPEIDINRIACMGDSGGGTITYYIACYDKRIKAAMPSCSFCTLQHSIGSIDHCVDNYIPGILQYFELADLAGLIAPRPLIIVNGATDEIFPIKYGRKAFKVVKEIYKMAGVPGNCAHVIGPGGHRFHADLAWPVFNELTSWQD